jgi:flagellar biosynthesis/type III secretory pathway chaperone
MKFYCTMMIGLTLLIVAGCNAGTTVKERHVRPSDPVVNMLHQGLIELNGNIDELTRHIAHLREMPTVSDPRVQELQGLDLAGWQLHLQQWVVQRDHLAASLDSIQQVQAAPQDKAALGSQWSERQAQFVQTMDELTAHRKKLEQKRIEVESQVLGQYFR